MGHSLEVESMLPHVQSKDGDHRRAVSSVHEGVVLVRGGGNLELPGRSHAEPGPARAEDCKGRSVKLLLHGVDTSKGSINGGGESRGGLATLVCGAHLLPEEGVVVVATSRVAHSTSGLQGILLKVQDGRGILASHGIVHVSDIGLVAAMK